MLPQCLVMVSIIEVWSRIQQHEGENFETITVKQRVEGSRPLNVFRQVGLNDPKLSHATRGLTKSSTSGSDDRGNAVPLCQQVSDEGGAGKPPGASH